MMFKSRFAVAIAATLLSVAGGTHAAEALTTYEPAGQVVRHQASLTQAGHRTIPTEQRQLSIEGTKALLASTEGSAWKVIGVEAGESCTLATERKLKNKRKKVEAKTCREARLNCENATAFARKHGAHAACSSLYTLTTVQLTSKASGAK